MSFAACGRKSGRLALVWHSIREELKIPGCRSLIRLDKPCCRGESPPCGELLPYETRAVFQEYGVSSLDPDEVPAERFQELISRHWEVENGLHGRKDRHFEEATRVCGFFFALSFTGILPIFFMIVFGTLP